MYTQIIDKKNLPFFSLINIRMSGKNISFNDKKIKKYTFYKNKTINNIEDINVNNILVSKKESYGNKNLVKYFIRYNDNITRPLCIKHPQMTVIVENLMKTQQCLL